MRYPNVIMTSFATFFIVFIIT